MICRNYCLSQTINFISNLDGIIRIKIWQGQLKCCNSQARLLYKRVFSVFECHWQGAFNQPHAFLFFTFN